MASEPANAEQQIDVVETDDRVTVTFRAREISKEKEVDAIGDEVLAALRQAGEHGKPLVVSFTGVLFVSSWMVGRLVLVMKEAKKTGQALRLCEMHADVLEIFEITRLSSMFDLREGREEDSPKVGS